MNTLFFKSLPTITAAEMCGDMPSTDATFEAANSAEYARSVPTPADLRAQSGSLKDLMTLFLGENWPNPDSSDMTVTKTEHLMSVIFGRLSDSPHMFRRLLIDHSSAFHHLCVAHLPRPTIDATSPGARHQTMERALAHHQFQKWGWKAACRFRKVCT
jgi:hypothetical protein